jgi:hypothetical protein
MHALVNDLAARGFAFHSMLGRTARFLHDDGRVFAVKLQKAGEPRRALSDQDAAVRVLSAHEREEKLASTLPTPHGVVCSDDILPHLRERLSAEELAQLEAMIHTGDGAGLNAYCYETRDLRYFNYLPDVADADAFEAGCSASLHDVTKLLADHDVVFDQFADIWHNDDPGSELRADGGRYQPFADLLRSWRGRPPGAGRLTNFPRAVEFPNAREDGISDEGDCKSAPALTTPDGELARKSLQDAFEMLGPHAPAVILENQKAEYLLTMELIAGKRALRKDADAETWQRTAELLRNLHAQALAVSAHVPEAWARRFLDAAVHTERWGTQMKFWMTREYIPHVVARKIPAQVYGDDVPVRVGKPSQFREGSFSEELGCSVAQSKDAPDLGFVNGQYPIKEGERARILVGLFSLLVTEAQTVGSALEEQGCALLDAGDATGAARVYADALAVWPWSIRARQGLLEAEQA